MWVRSAIATFWIERPRRLWAAAERRSAGSDMGGKPKLTEAQQAEARKWRAEGATLTELACSYGVGKSTISRQTG